MCLLILEILFLISGIWLLISGKVPNRLFQILFGKGDYQLSPANARLVGLFLSSPLPLVMGVSFILGILSIKNAVALASGFEILYVLAVCVIVIIIARRNGRSVTQAPPTIPTSGNIEPR